MIFIKHEQGKVFYKHMKPFDEKFGLNKTQEELEIEGLLVNELPEPEEQEGKISTLHINPQTKEMWYEYQNEED